MANNLVINHANIMVMLACNLNCKLCSACIPYEKDKKVSSIDKLREAVDHLFDIATFVGVLDIIGGEPLLYPKLAEFFQMLYGYASQIGTVKIVSNGSIVPDDNLLRVLKKYGEQFLFFLDNYGEDLSTKIPEIMEILEEWEIPYTVRDYCTEDVHCGGWVDFGNVKERKHSLEEAKVLFSKCAVSSKSNFCFPISDGILFACTPVRRRYELGLKVNPNEYINLLDENISIEEKRNTIENIYNGNCLSACEYCNGMCDDSPRFRPAEQLTKRELEEIKGGRFFR